MTSFELGPSGSLAMSPTGDKSLGSSLKSASFSGAPILGRKKPAFTGDKHLDSLLALADEVSSLEDSTLTLSAIELSSEELLYSHLGIPSWGPIS